MDIEKITIHKDSSITIDFKTIREAPEGEDPIYESVKFKSNRKAHQAFYETLSALKPHAIDMLEVGEDEIVRISIKGATFKRTKEGILGVVILIERAMDHAETPIRISTPHYIAESYSEDGDESNILTEDCLIILKKLKGEAERYVAGFRDQIEMDV